MARGSSTCDVKDILKDKFYFPSFRELMDENELDERYFEEDYRTGIWFHAYTWYFLAEITNDDVSQITFLRNRVLVRDRSGRDHIPVAFYPESGSFDFKTLKKGHTVCVIQAQQHHFLDLSLGLRIENLDTIRVIPCALDDLFTLSTFYFERKNTCWACGKKATADTKEAAIAIELKKCAACHTAQYCCKDCQVKDWKERHRRWCKAMPEFLKLTKIDYTTRNRRSHYSRNW